MMNAVADRQHAVPCRIAQPLLEAIPGPARIVQFARNDEIVGQGDAAEFCFQVVEGCVRTVRLLEDGRRQVGEFLLAGDVFGCEAEGSHEFAAEAVTPVTLRRFPLAAIEERAALDQSFDRSLRQYLFAQLRRAGDHLVLVGRKTAAERLASFLLTMSGRLPASGAGGMDLPMCRADMADHLGLTIETVCRELTGLRRRAVIAVDRTRVAIHDSSALRQAAAAGTC